MGRAGRKRRLKSVPTDSFSQEGGSDQSTAHFSVYVGNTSLAAIPPVPNNSTLIVCQSYGVPFANLSLQGANTALTMFAASNVTVFMSGGFWTLARPSLVPSLCTHFTCAGIEWRRCQHAVCMARPHKEPHHSGQAEP